MQRATYAQIHAHSKYSINSLSGEGVFHRYTWQMERGFMKLLMFTPEKLVSEARRHGISYLAITDHNRVPDIDSFENILIKGEEWGQRKGHSNFIDLKYSIDPECGFFEGVEPKEPRGFQEAAQIAREQGAFIVVNHPFKRDKWLWGDESLSLVDAVEVWNGAWSKENLRALHYWQALLERGLKLFATAGSDFHVKWLFHLDENLIATDPVSSKKEFMDKLRKGEFSLVKNTHEPIVFLTRKLDYHIEGEMKEIEMRIIQGDQVNKDSRPVKDGRIERIGQERFVRIELWKDSVPVSLSNPVFF